MCIRDRAGEASPAVDQVKGKSRSGRPKHPPIERAAARLRKGDSADDVIREYYASQKPPIVAATKNDGINFWRSMRKYGLGKPRKGETRAREVAKS